MDGFVIDVAGEDELVEIQTASFASARRKLERLVASHRVVLVYPIPIEKWLVLVDADGVLVRRRRSPKRGLELDLFDELVHIPGLVAHPNFRIELPLISEEEIRGPVPDGARYRYPRQWWRLDRRLLDVVETRRIDTPADLLCLLPPRPARALHHRRHRRRERPLEAAREMRAVYCLERSDAVARLARRGRLVTYSRLAPSATVEPGRSVVINDQHECVGGQGQGRDR